MSFHLREALLQMRGNFTATLSTLITMTLTLLMLGFVVLLTLNVDRTLAQLESQVEIAAFLSDGADTAALTKAVRDQPQVTEVQLVSKAKVLSEMSRDYPYAEEAATLAGNPFPDTLRLRVARVEDSRAVAEQVRALPGVVDVEYGAGYVDQTVKTLSAVRGAGYTLVGLLLIGTLFNILSAVRVAIYARRSEIFVMRLLGATRAFIRAPHLIEGVLLGLLAGLIASALLAPSYLQLSLRVQELVPVLPIITDLPTVSPVLIGLLLLGVLVGLAGSVFATQRYLRELE
ncbi:ABC transporter permease [Deinococcus psychrotolerans]|uniref:Cell division protein FtsX n=2 Tax=Deinococcus TaxID=1298 RepID=A0A553V067_9DEIO|nr:MULTISPECIES: ABC transporter permease [Deinococcus]AZI42300.1 ABC transporter permease [Deinococcus psychrotolerans]TSA85857.1 ABC transporter permease [Deinococcus detaillensis]